MKPLLQPCLSLCHTFGREGFGRRESDGKKAEAQGFGFQVFRREEEIHQKKVGVGF